MVLQAVWSSLLITISLIGLSGAQTCTTPSVRREWRTLSTSEKTDFLSAVKCLNSLPHDNSIAPLNGSDLNGRTPIPVNASGSYYDDIVFLHYNLIPIIRWTGLFFPFHRWHITMFEKALQTKCGYTGTLPYWDWNLDVADVKNSPIFDADPVSGLGTWGDPSDDVRVQDGALGKSSSFRLSYPAPHSLRRNFTLQPYLKGSIWWAPENNSLEANATFTDEEIEKMRTGFTGNFSAFQTYVEGWQGVHISAHNIVGGDLAGLCPGDAPAGCRNSPGYTPNDPLFFMHHARVDKLWSDWQQNDPANALAFAGGSVAVTQNVTIFNQFPTGAPPELFPNSTIPGQGLFPDATIADVLDTAGGFLCYVYE